MAKRGLNRDRLVTIAHEYVSANGLDAFTMRRLAAAAEVSPGALYKHFHDWRDLRRAMAEEVFRAVDLTDIDPSHPTVDQVIICCERMREAMLRFREGGRIVAGSYAPSTSAVRLSSTLLTLLQAITLPDFNAGDIAFALRSYTTGFVIEEQSYLALRNTGEWEALVGAIPPGEYSRSAEPAEPANIITIMTGNRDQRFTAGLVAIMTGTFRAHPVSGTSPATR